MTNKTFKCGNPFWANACVGNNGIVSYITYAEGFSKAANTLLKYVLNNNGDHVDSYIYPICFNMRHSIELRLKGAVEKLLKLSTIKSNNLPEFNLISSHDIGNIWNYYKVESERLDTRFVSVNALMEPTILDIAQIDPTGQTFRYPYNIDKKKHLIKQSTINCLTLYEKFSELELFFNNLYDLTLSLIEEYKLNTFTAKLSRSQLFKLAQDLPKYNQWSTSLMKEPLKQKYSLSSNDLTKALNIIKENYETCGLIRKNKDLKTLTDDLLKEICESWVSFYPKLQQSNNIQGHLNYNNINDIKKRFEKYAEHSKLKNSLYLIFKDKLTKESIADLISLFNIAAHNIKYSEEYIQHYELYKKTLTDHNHIRDSFYKIFSTKKFLEYIVIGLFFLYKTDLAEEIIKKYDLEESVTKIPDARNRELFKKWVNLDYS